MVWNVPFNAVNNILVLLEMAKGAKVRECRDKQRNSAINTDLQNESCFPEELVFARKFAQASS